MDFRHKATAFGNPSDESLRWHVSDAAVNVVDQARAAGWELADSPTVAVERQRHGTVHIYANVKGNSE